MTDPRVERTRIHVRAIILKMIAGDDELTISAVAAAAQVSRRTIYAHWGTIEDLVADSVFAAHEGIEREAFLVTCKNPLRLLPSMVRELVAQRALAGPGQVTGA